MKSGRDGGKKIVVSPLRNCVFPKYTVYAILPGHCKNLKRMCKYVYKKSHSCEEFDVYVMEEFNLSNISRNIYNFADIESACFWIIMGTIILYNIIEMHSIM